MFDRLVRVGWSPTTFLLYTHTRTSTERADLTSALSFCAGLIDFDTHHRAHIRLHIHGL